MLQRPLRILLLIAGVALVASAAFALTERRPQGPIACGGDRGGIGCATENDLAALPAKEGPAPDFTLPMLAGNNLTLSYAVAKQPVILDFWASWCPHCQRNMPKLDALSRAYDGRITVIGVNMKERSDVVRRFIDAHGISYPIVLDAGAVAEAYGVRYTNTHVLIGKDGTIRKVLVGDIAEADLQDLLDAP